MLVLSRKKDESIVIGDNIVVTVIEIRGNKVRLGIEAPEEVPIHRHDAKTGADGALRIVELDTTTGMINELDETKPDPIMA